MMEERGVWGTWEELLLACAVGRHGTRSWEAVAKEVRAKSTSARTALTAHGCHQRYRHLQRRFGGDVAGEAVGEVDVPWIDELRRLRVAELRCEVQSCDLSIKSLHLKLERLKGDDDRSVGEADPDRNGEETARNASVDRISGAASTHPMEEEEGKPRSDPADGEDEKAAESATKSKQEEEGPWRSSDEEQSSAVNRIDKEMKPDDSIGGGLEPLVSFLETIRSNEHGSIFQRRLQSQESEPYRSLVRRHVDLEMVRSKLLGEGHGGDGPYKSAAELFRDLLLLCTNAIVFYPKNSPESIAAVHLRDLVSKEMSSSSTHNLLEPLPLPSPTVKTDADLPGSASVEEKPAAAPAPTVEIDANLPSSATVEKKPPLVVCRRRSSALTATKQAARAEEEKDKNLDVDKEETKDKRIAEGTRQLRSTKDRRGRRRAVGMGGVAKMKKAPSRPTPPPSSSSMPKRNAHATRVSAGKESESNRQATHGDNQRRDRVGTTKSSATVAAAAKQNATMNPGGLGRPRRPSKQAAQPPMPPPAPGKKTRKRPEVVAPSRTTAKKRRR